MKRMLNTPKMDKNKAASPNLALPRRSLNRTCQKKQRRVGDGSPPPPSCHRGRGCAEEAGPGVQGRSAGYGQMRPHSALRERVVGSVLGVWHKRPDLGSAPGDSDTSLASWRASPGVTALTRGSLCVAVRTARPSFRASEDGDAAERRAATRMHSSGDLGFERHSQTPQGKGLWLRRHFP